MRLSLLGLAAVLAPCAAGWRTCDPMAHGAAGTGAVYDTAALRAAAAECGAAGGGTLLLAAGRTFLTGHFNLSSNTELRVEGTLLGSPNATDYALVQPLPWYGPDPGALEDAREWAPLVQSWYASNVSITGAGVLDGNGAAWWRCAGNISAPPCAGHTRPHGIRLVGGAGFRISGVTIRDMPMWQVHLAYVTDVHVHDVSITAPDSGGPNPSHNTDGIDPDCAQDVLIERVYISTGDDNIAIKSGRDWFGRTFGRPSRNITVRDSVFGTGHGMAVGSEMSGGVSEVLFENITGTGGVCGPRIKSERGRGGAVANVTYRGIRLSRMSSLALQVTDNYQPGIPPTNATATPTFTNITMEDIEALDCKGGAVLDGLPESPIRGLTLRNVSLLGTPSGKLWKTCDYVDTASAVCQGVAPACPPCMLPPPAQPLPAPLPAHPRLILTPARAAAIAGAAADPADARARALAAATAAQAAAVLAQRPPGPSGNASAPNARVRLQNLYSLVLAAAVAGSAPPGPSAPALRARAAAEVLGPCASPHWEAPAAGGAVQLNTGEMLHVCGFALDWLYEDLTPPQRSALVSAIVGSGLAGIRSALGAAPPAWAVSFVSTRSNWNTVILGGAVMGALAVADEPGVPAWVAGEVLPRALANLRAWSAAGFGPDGAWPEGPNYGGYAARYLAPTIGALRSATGSDGGLAALPGVLDSPAYLLATMAPNLEYFYYYDSRCDPETVAAYLAFAVLAGDGARAAGVVDLVLALAPSVPANATSNNVMNAPVALLYYDAALVASGSAAAAAAAAAAPPAPQLAHFDGVALVTARAAPGPGAAFAAFKGRTTLHGLWAHTHLDAGSFVLQLRDQWWAQDLGSDEYSAPGYFSPSRFQLYRTGSLGHNTLTFGGANQFCVVESTYACNCSQAPLVLYREAPPPAALPLPPLAPPPPLALAAYAITDLTAAYAPLGLGLARVQRGFLVSDSVEQLVVVDEVDFTSGGDGDTSALPPLWWSLHTVADIALSSDGLRAELTLGNVTGLVVSVAVLPSATACPGAAFGVVAVDLQPPLLPSPRVQRLTLAAPAATCRRLSVAVGVVERGWDLSIRPLAQWEALGPL